MKTLSLLGVVLAATMGISAAGVRIADAEPCVGPFRQCAINVGATCERTPRGTQRIVYFDYPGHVMTFERCVGQVFESAGQPNPYVTGRVTISQYRRGSALSIPESELLYPFMTD